MTASRQGGAVIGIVYESALILSIAIALGLLVNWIRHDGLTLKGGWSEEAFEKRHLGKDLKAVSLEEAFRAFKAGEVFFVDARSRDEFALGHIEGALSIPLVEANELMEEMEAFLPKDAEIISYCDGVDCPLSSDLARMLKGGGYAGVRVLANGWSLWRDAGYPIEMGESE